MEFATGQPCWMDVTVKDVEARDGLMDFLAGVSVGLSRLAAPRPVTTRWRSVMEIGSRH